MDWTGNKSSVFSTIGAKGHTKEERQTEDFYATDPIAIDKLATKFNIPHIVWEPACGQGHLAERLMQQGHIVHASDIIDRGYGTPDIDFLSLQADAFLQKIQPIDCIITNPPYKFTTQFILQALRLLKDGQYAAFFLKTTALESKTRYNQIYKHTPQKYVLQFIERVFCAKNGDFIYSKKQLGSGAQAYAWFIFQKNYKGPTTLDWI